MEDQKYLARHQWLKAYLAHASYDVPLWIEQRMHIFGLDLLDIDQVVEDGIVLWAELDYGYCHFAIRGRNYDDNEISVYGCFDDNTMTFILTEITKH